MNKKLSLALAGAGLTASIVGDTFFGRSFTESDVRCQEKKVAKRRAKNKMKRKSKYGH